MVEAAWVRKARYVSPETTEWLTSTSGQIKDGGQGLNGKLGYSCRNSLGYFMYFLDSEQ